MGTSAFAEDQIEFRPAWAQGQYQQPANSSILYLNQDPNFVNGGMGGGNIISPKKANELKADYDNRTRDYDMRQAYGMNTQVDEMNHEQQMKDFSHTVLNAARNSQAQVYGGNIAQSEKNGDVSQPLVYVGGAASFGMGTPLDLKLDDETKATWRGDAMQRHGQIDVKNPNLSASVMMDASASPIERYTVSVNKPLVLSFNSSVQYGGTSNTVNGSLSRPIVDRLSGSIGATVPAGNSPTGALPQATAGLSYGITF